MYIKDVKGHYTSSLYFMVSYLTAHRLREVLFIAGECATNPCECPPNEREMKLDLIQLLSAGPAGHFSSGV